MAENSEPGPSDPLQGAGPYAHDAATKDVLEPADKTAEDAPETVLTRVAQEYLAGLMSNIRTMLAYVNSNGITVPDELRSKIDALMENPAVEKDTSHLNVGKERRHGLWRLGIGA